MINKKQIINVFEDRFNNYILKDIRIMLDIDKGKRPKRNRRKYMSYVSSVILMSCAIDYLSKYRFGHDHVNNRDYSGDELNNTDCYKKFVSNYFTKKITYSKKDYDPKIIYKDVRCALTHGHSLGKEVVLTHEDKYKNNHMEKIFISELKEKRCVIDVYLLYYDLERVVRLYISELKKKKDLKAAFFFRWNKHPFVRGYKKKISKKKKR